MSKNIIKFPQEPTADEILDRAKGNYKDLMIIGYDQEGRVVMQGTVETDRANFMFDMAKKILMDECFNYDDDDIVH